MIISNSQVQCILKWQATAYQQGLGTKTGSGSQINASKLSTLKDSLELSGRAREMGSVKEKVLKSSEARADKINELKFQVQTGKYQVPAAEIATKMINRSLADELARR